MFINGEEIRLQIDHVRADYLILNAPNFVEINNKHITAGTSIGEMRCEYILCFSDSNHEIANVVTDAVANAVTSAQRRFTKHCINI